MSANDSASPLTRSLRSVAGCLVLLCLGLMLAAPGTLAQTPTGSIEGTVTDPSGAVIVGARVVVTEVATGRKLEYVTNELGRFASRNLLPGVYRVSVEARGFATKNLENMMVNSGAVASADLKMEIGKTGEVITVDAEAIAVDTARHTVDSVIGSKEIKDVPLFTRNFLELAALAPGVYIRDGGAIDPTKERAYLTVGVSGRSGTATRVQVDGIDVTDETVGSTVANFSNESVSEFQLTRSSLDPSTSLTSSGSINIISKQGSNTIHGGWFWDYFNQDMGARINYNQTEAYPFKRNRTGGNLGGPLKKDKIFWFTSYERHYQTEEAVSRNVLFPQLNVQQDFPIGIRYFDGRMDFNLTSNLRLFGKFHHDWNLANGGSAVSPFQNINWTNTTTVGADYNKSNLTHSLRFGYVNFNNQIASQELKYKFLRAPNGIPYYLGVGSFGAGPNSLAPQATYQDNAQISYEGSWFKGKHTLRYGFDFRHILLGGFANFAGPLQINGTYDDQTVADLKKAGKNLQDPLEYPLEYFSMGPANGFFTLRPAHNLAHGGHLTKRTGIFVQDSYKVLRNLTLNIGVRWQYDTGYFSDPSVKREPAMARWIKGAELQPVMPKTLFSPSFGFAWDPAGTGKTVIRGGFYKGYEMNIQNNTMFDEFAMLPNGLGPDLYEIYGVTTPDGKPINVDGKHADGDYSDMIGTPIKNAIGTIGLLQAALNDAYANYKFDPNKGQSSFLSSGGFYYGAVIPGNQFKIPYALQFNIGVQRSLRPGVVFAVDYIRNHAVGLPFTRVDFEQRRDSATLNVAAASKKINSVLAGKSMDQWIAANPTKNISAFGLISDAIFPGLYPDMTRARFIQGGFTTYNALQFTLRGTHHQVWKFRDVGYNFNYSFGRNESSSTVGRVEFIATTDCNHGHNSRACYGPSGLDRTSMLTSSFVFTTPGGFRFNSLWSFRTAGPQNIYIPNFGGATSGNNSVFATDIDGDNFGNRLPGLGAGQFGRAVKSLDELNRIIQGFNGSYSGQLTAHAKALVQAGLYTEAQLKKLGAVMPTIPLVPGTNPNPWNNMFVTDLRFDRPTKLFPKMRENMVLTPFLDFYNIFNHSPAGTYGGLGATYGSLNFDYSKNQGQMASDLNVTRGRINATRKLMIGIRFDF